MSSAPSPPASLLRFPKRKACEPPPRRVTLRDIAKAVGVTAMTVSRALRNQPRISATVRERIQKKAKEMGYRPDPALSALVQYQQAKAGSPLQAALAWFKRWPNPKPQGPFRDFDLYWRGARISAEKLGFRLEEFVVDDAMPPEDMAASLHTRNIRGILVTPDLVQGDWIGRFAWSQFSVVGLTEIPATMPIHSVTAHRVHNAVRALAEMRARGYRRIGFASWQVRGFGAGVRWDRLSPEDETCVPVCPLSGENHEAERQRFEAWWREHRPDAILTDLPWIPGKLKAMGVRVPKELGLAGLSFRDSPIDAGLDQNPEEIGRVGVLVLASLINDGDVGFPRMRREILIEGTWVDGTSLPDRNAAERRKR